MGSPMPRTGLPSAEWSSRNDCQAGMIRAGLRPRTAMSTNFTFRAAGPRVSRNQLACSSDHRHHHWLASGQAFLDEGAEDGGELPGIAPHKGLVAIALPGSGWSLRHISSCKTAVSQPPAPIRRYPGRRSCPDGNGIITERGGLEVHSEPARTRFALVSIWQLPVRSSGGAGQPEVGSINQEDTNDHHHRPAVAGCTPAERVSRSLLEYGIIIAGPMHVLISLAQAVTRDGFDFARHEQARWRTAPFGWIQSATLVLSRRNDHGCRRWIRS